MVVNYPWDYDIDEIAPDNELLIERSLDYSTRNASMYASPYFENGIVRGAVWYSVNGTMNDWNYWATGTPHYIVELSDNKWPFPYLLEDMWDENYESMMYVIERAQEGVHVIVTDSASFAPLGAEITITDLPWTYNSDSIVGDFHRELLEGTYEITVSKENYNTKVVSGIYVPDDSRIDIEVFLTSSVEINESFTPSTVDISIYPNPFNAICQIRTENFSDIEIFNINGNLVSKSTNTNLHIWIPKSDIATGVYLVHISNDIFDTTRKIYLVK